MQSRKIHTMHESRGRAVDTVPPNEETVARRFVLGLHVFSWIVAAVIVAPPSGLQLTKLPDVSDFQPGHDLSSYRTYAWNKNQTVPTESMANHLRIINAIQEHMKSHGFRIDTVRPDVRIQYRLEIQQRVRGSSSQQRSVWDNANSTVQIDFSRVKEAHFSIQMVEAESNFFLWQADGVYPVATPDRAEIQIKEAVDKLFEQYPSHD